jgi:hypothetical protein
MALSSAELYSLILAALTYLQDDGHQFERGIAKAALTPDEFWLLNGSVTSLGCRALLTFSPPPPHRLRAISRP